MKLGDVIALATIILVVLLAMIIASNLHSIYGETVKNKENAAIQTSLFDNTWTGLVVASIGIIIAAAVGLLSLIMGSLLGDTDTWEGKIDTSPPTSPMKILEHKHPLIWTCSYCNQVNNWEDKRCFICGSPRNRRIKS